ncbi:MAG: hypothetical protein JWM64_1074 [Frankiales bacterium]|nr:hypothetical protein [Frankiales bacterium]
MRTSTSSRLAPLVASGVVTRQQLLAAGADRTLFDREVRAGRWTRPFPGVALTAPSPTQVQLARAGLAAAGPGAAITGLTACRLHRLRDVPEGGPVDLLVPVRQRLQVPDGVRLRRTQHDVVVERWDDLRLVGPDQAVTDAALRLPGRRDVRALVLAAVADGRVALPRLQALLDCAPQRGSGHLRHALVDAQRGAVSAPEAEVVDLLLPVARRLRLELLVNADVLLDGRLVGRVDALLPALGLGVEVDSVRHHGSGADLEATLRRHERFAAVGLRLLHVTPWSVRTTPHDVVARVRAAIGQPVLLLPGVEVRPRRTP